jgi:hypothetical protein
MYPTDLQLASAAPGAGDAMGRIRNIVKTAHKWGGDGRRPIFRQIRSVLTSQHPEVIAKAFGGDPNKAAGWVKARWYQLRGRPVPATTGKHALDQDDGTSLDLDHLEQEFNLVSDELVSQMAELGVTHELFCDEGDVSEDDGLVWKTVARTGTWQVSPLKDGRPLVLDEPFFDDLTSAFSEQAWPHVTVPLSHKDKIAENTGFVKQLVKVPDPARPGHFKLRAGIHFTEPDVLGKVTRGTIANTSIGADLRGVRRTEDGKFFPRVLKHVALTNAPWLNGLEPFGDQMAASLASWEEAPTEADLEDGFGAMLSLAQEGEWTPDLELDAEVAAEILELGWMPGDVTEADLHDGDFAVVHTDPNGTKVRKLPYKIHGKVHEGGWKAAWSMVSKTKLPSGVQEFQVRKKLLKDKPTSVLANASKLAASATAGDAPVLRLYRGGDTVAGTENDGEGGGELTLTQDQLTELITKEATRIADEKTVALSRRAREADVRDIVRNLEEKGHAPAFVKQAEALMLSATADPILTLSQEDEDGTTTETTHTVDSIILALAEAVPATGLNLGQRAPSPTATRPALDDIRKSAKERAEALYEDLKTGEKVSLAG